MLNGVSSLMVLFLPLVVVRRLVSCSENAVLLLSIFLIALDPLLIRYSSLPMTEVACAAILLCAVSLLTQAFEWNSRHESETKGRSILLASFAGLMFAAGSLVRPVVLVAFAATMFVITLNSLPSLRRNKPTGVEARDSLVGKFRLIVTVLIGFVIGMSPWIVRNWLQFEQIIPATTHGGYTLALGNNTDFYRDVIRGTDQFPWDGDALDRWQKRMIQQANLDGIPADSETANDAWYYQQAKAAIANDWSSFASSCWLRLCRFWAISTADESVPQSVRMLTSGWYAVVWVGLLLNLLSLRRRLFRPSSHDGSASCSRQRINQIMLWSIIAAFVAMHIVYWTDTRMRAPVMPIVAILSAIGWCETLQRSNQRLPELQ